MRIPTHVVIDPTDGWTWTRDRNGNPFVESTATEWAATLNHERKVIDGNMGRTRSGFIVAAVTPVMSPELMAAVIRDYPDAAAIEAAEAAGVKHDPEYPLDEIRGKVE